MILPQVAVQLVLVRVAVADLIKNVSGKVALNPRRERELRIMRAVEDVAGENQ